MSLDSKVQAKDSVDEDFSMINEVQINKKSLVSTVSEFALYGGICSAIFVQIDYLYLKNISFGKFDIISFIGYNYISIGSHFLFSVAAGGAFGALVYREQLND